MSVAIKRLLIDALKPRELSIVELAKALGIVDEKGEVEIVIREVDSRTETIKVTIRGSNIDYKLVLRIMEKNGVSIRGIDEVNTARE
jgi:uncharacterized protein